MKRKILALFMAVVMTTATMAVPASAAGTARFSDVSDQNTRVAIETLRIMGVLDGYGDGTFRPSNQLTRAQFSKMASYAMNAGNELGFYKTVTIFPDVKPSHWAAGYINLAAKGKGVISGYPDGKFYPERTVTVGQAVTILLRLLGYKDADVGGVWPDSYMAAGSMIGLTDGLNAEGNAPLTRAQAAKLFVNLLRAETKEGGTLYAMSGETELLSVDGGMGILKTSDGKSYSMVNPVASTALMGMRGRVVLSGDKALTFLPSATQSGGNAATAVIVGADYSSVGFDELAGNSSYQIYKNGSPATRNDLRKNDVAIYHAATNSILVCDTKVSVFYEACEPTPTAPVKITVLNGTELYVLPSAMESLANFKPGKKMTLLLTVDGQVAAAVESGGNIRSNAIGVVDETGEVSLLCGNNTVKLAFTAEEKYCGQVVRISSSAREKVSMTVQSSSVSGDLYISKRMLGNKPLAENALVIDNGQQVGLGQITNDVIREEQIKFARTNWAGEVDLVVLDRGTGETYGRVFIEYEKTPVFDESGNKTGETYLEQVGLEFGNGESERFGPFGARYGVKTGDYAAAKVNRDGSGFAMLQKLTGIRDVSWDLWIGKTAVTFAGKTYEVPENVQCYNADNQEWISMEQAKAYSDTANLYVRDGIVRIVEVRHNAD